jgi:cell division septation protein DedD
LTVERAKPIIEWEERGSPLRWIGVLLAMGVAAAVGFLVGRDIIGERYVRRTVVPVRVPYASARSGAIGEPTVTVTPTGQESAVGGLAGRAIEQVEVKTELGGAPAANAEKRPRAPEPTPPKPKRYTVQVGVFLDSENSRLLQEDLKNRGYSSHLKTAEEGGQKLTRVRIGSYPNPDAAAAAAEEMWQQGYRVIVVPED